MKVEIKAFEVKIQKAFEKYINSRIKEQKFKSTIEDLAKKKNALQ